jgi:hypothetical protein
MPVNTDDLEGTAMATTTELAPGQIATPEGADKLRGELLSAHTVHCGESWMATASVYSDGAAEIHVSIQYDSNSQKWSAHEYYYSFEKATQALVAFEATGALPSEEDL